MKKVLAIMMALVMCLGVFAACGQTAAPAQPEAAPAAQPEAAPEAAEPEVPAAEKYLIGVSFFGLSNSEFNVALKDAIYERYEEKYKDVADLLFLDADGDPTVQLSQVDDMIAQGINCLILNPNDKDAMAAASEKCKELGIPCIELCNETAAVEARTTYVGSEDIVSGRMLAQALLGASGDGAKIVVLHGWVGQTPEVRRHEGLQEILESEYPESEIVYEKVCDWDRVTAQTTIEDLIQSNLDFNVVFCENDEMALGAMVALEEAGLLDKVYCGGIDAVPEALEAVRDGRLTCTIFQDAHTQGVTSLDVAIEACEGKTIEPMYSIPYATITKENVDEYLN